MKIVELYNFPKFSLDASDRLYRPDRPRAVEAVLNNSFQKGNLYTKNIFALTLGPQNVLKPSSGPNLGTFLNHSGLN